jgi:hypothetical protein
LYSVGNAKFGTSYPPSTTYCPALLQNSSSHTVTLAHRLPSSFGRESVGTLFGALISIAKIGVRVS